MRPGRHLLLLAAVLALLVALVVSRAWWLDLSQNAVLSVLGVSLLALGVVLTVLNLTVSDERLGRHCGNQTPEVRRTLRQSWMGILGGAALLGIVVVDRWHREAVAEAEFAAAYNRGHTSSKAGDWRAAADAFTEAIRLDPRSAKAHGARAVAWIKQGELERALDDLDEAIRLDPDDAKTRYNRGVAHARRGEDDRALSDFTEAIRLDPNYARAYLARSRVYARKGDAARSAADRKKALELDPALDVSRDLIL